MTAPVSVILIREHAEQLTGSGCCGKLQGDQVAKGRGSALFRHTRADQESIGVLHRAIREFFPPRGGRESVTVTTIDPRNQLSLVPKLTADVLRYRPPWNDALRTTFQLFSLPAVIVNGRVLSRRGQPLDPDALCDEISRLLGGRIPKSQTACSLSD